MVNDAPWVRPWYSKTDAAMMTQTLIVGWQEECPVSSLSKTTARNCRILLIGSILCIHCRRILLFVVLYQWSSLPYFLSTLMHSHFPCQGVIDIPRSLCQFHWYFPDEKTFDIVHLALKAKLSLKDCILWGFVLFLVLAISPPTPPRAQSWLLCWVFMIFQNYSITAIVFLLKPTSTLRYLIESLIYKP